MGVSTHVGVDAEAHRCHLTFIGGNLIDDLQLGDALNIEAEDAPVESQLNLPIAFTHTCKYYLVCREASLEHLFYFPPRHTVYTKACLVDDLEHLEVGISLYCVVDEIVVVFLCFCVDGVKCLTQYVCVVIVERCADARKPFYWKFNAHNLYSLNRWSLSDWSAFFLSSAEMRKEMLWLEPP